MSRSFLSRAGRRVKSFLGQEIWERELSELGRLKGFLFYQLRVIFLVMRGFAKDRCGLRAAGLSYIALLTLIPFLAVVFSISTRFGGLNEISEKYLKPAIYGFLTFETGIGTDDGPGEGEGGEPGEAGPGPEEGEGKAEEGRRDPEGEPGGDDAAQETPEAPAGAVLQKKPDGRIDVEAVQREISVFFDGFIERIETGKLGGIAAIFMLLGTVALLSHIERSFNDIWGVKRSRTWFQRTTVYWTVITFGPALLAVSLALTASFRASSVILWVRDHLPFLEEVVFQLVIPLVFTWGAFTLLYKFMPNTRVRLTSALGGAILAGTLWEAAKWGYTAYAAQMIKWESMFGALAAIPILLIWIYLTWVIVLFGAELAFAHQNARTYRKEEASLSASPYYREVVCLGIMARIGRHHSGGFVPPSSSDLAEEMNVPVRLVQDLLFLLTKYGLVMEASGTEKSPGHVPSRPLDQIRVQEVVNIVRHHSPMPLTLPSGEETPSVVHLVEEADRAREAAFEPVTIGELISGLSHGQETPPPVAGGGFLHAEGAVVDEGTHQEERPPAPVEQGVPMDGWGDEEWAEGEETQPDSAEEIPTDGPPAEEAPPSGPDDPEPGSTTA